MLLNGTPLACHTHVHPSSRLQALVSPYSVRPSTYVLLTVHLEHLDKQIISPLIQARQATVLVPPRNLENTFQ